MAISVLIYNNLLELQETGTLPDLETTNSMGMLLLEVDDEGNTATQKARASVSAILATDATELSSTGYSRQFIANVAVTRDDTNSVVEVTGDDVNFGALVQATSEDIVAAIIYIDDEADSDRLPLWKVTATGGDAVTPNGENFYLRFNGSVSGSDGVIWRSQQGS